MKKLLLLLLIFNINCYSQDFGKYKLEKFISYNQKTKFINNTWYCDKDLKFCFRSYNQTPIGIKNIVSDVKSILYSNGISFEKTFINDSFYSSLVKDINDYEILNATVLQESSIVKMQWRIDSMTYLMLNIEKEEYKITLLKL